MPQEVGGVLPPHPLRISTSTHGMKLKLKPLIPLDKRRWLITLSLLSRDPRVFYRPETKRGPDALFQVLSLLLTSNFKILSDVFGWQKNIINDVIMTVTWPGYSLNTRYKMRTRFNILGSPRTIAFRLCQIRLAKELN